MPRYHRPPPLASRPPGSHPCPRQNDGPSGGFSDGPSIRFPYPQGFALPAGSTALPASLAASTAGERQHDQDQSECFHFSTSSQRLGVEELRELTGTISGGYQPAFPPPPPANDRTIRIRARASITHLISVWVCLSCSPSASRRTTGRQSTRRAICTSVYNKHGNLLSLCALHGMQNALRMERDGVDLSSSLDTNHGNAITNAMITI